MKIEKVKEHIGAIVTGIDLAHPIDGATRKKLYDAVVENVVLVIRGQEHLTPAQLQAAGEMFGELMEDQNRRYLVDGFPLISVLDNRHTGQQGSAGKSRRQCHLAHRPHQPGIAAQVHHAVCGGSAG